MCKCYGWYAYNVKDWHELLTNILSIILYVKLNICMDRWMHVHIYILHALTCFKCKRSNITETLPQCAFGGEISPPLLPRMLHIIVRKTCSTCVASSYQRQCKFAGQLSSLIRKRTTKYKWTWDWGLHKNTLVAVCAQEVPSGVKIIIGPHTRKALG